MAWWPIGIHEEPDFMNYIKRGLFYKTPNNEAVW